jgi:hypothetical protein
MKRTRGPGKALAGLNKEERKARTREQQKKHADYMRDFYQKHPEARAEKLRKSVASMRLLNYGVSAEDYERRLVDQNGVCAICRRAETATLKGKVKSLAVDHCHTTKKVRGLLCANCNHGLGKFGDEPALLRAAADYLEKSR